MKIDFDKVLKAAMPDTIELDVGGRSYRLKDPAVIDVAGFDGVREAREGERDEEHAARIVAFLRGWFDGEAPPLLGEVPAGGRERARWVGQVTALVQVIAELVVEMSSLPNVMARARTATRAQIEQRNGSAS